jgi:putative DNA primase/helicase
MKFLDEILGGNGALLDYAQRVAGYSLTGDTREQCLFYFHGPGANGKTTLMETLRAGMGDYAQQADFETFLQQKNPTIRNDLARLKGARMVSAIEADATRKMAEALIKHITGGDTIIARYLHQEFFEFQPQFKIFLAANHKVSIHGTDHAIWRRIRLIPFDVTIAEDKQDRDLPRKLRVELPGILAWAVEGCLKWQREGLGMPDEVRTATEGYREEMDILSGFIGERCLIDDRLKTTAKDLYQDYLEWCHDTGEKGVSQRTFGMRLSERGLTKRRTGGGYQWLGIGLLVNEVNDNEPCGYVFSRDTDSKEKHSQVVHNGSHGSLPSKMPGHLEGRITPKLAEEVYGPEGE